MIFVTVTSTAMIAVFMAPTIFATTTVLASATLFSIAYCQLIAATFIPATAAWRRIAILPIIDLPITRLLKSLCAILSMRDFTAQIDLLRLGFAIPCNDFRFTT
jgi:hypothetical protein